MPVIAASPAEQPSQRPTVVWILLGGVVILSAWVPLLLVALLLGRALAQRIPEAMSTSPGPSFLVVAPTALLVLATFAAASAVGGAVVGRFDDRPVRWNATAAGALAVVFILVLAALGHALGPPSLAAFVCLILLSIALPAAALGGRWGERRRTPSNGRKSDSTPS